MNEEYNLECPCCKTKFTFQKTGKVLVTEDGLFAFFCSNDCRDAFEIAPLPLDPYTVTIAINDLVGK